MTEDLQEKYAEKIAGLLRKAESTTPEEAETLVEKAQELMAKYAIEQAMVDAKRGVVREKVVEKRVVYGGSYSHAHYELGSVIAVVNDCRVLRSKTKNQHTLYVIGFESDVDRAIMLDTSLQIQMEVALRAARRSGAVRSEYWMTAMDKFKENRTFKFGFADGVAVRLHRAKQAGRDEYVRDTGEAGVTDSMALVVRSRRDQVNDWVDKTYGQLRSGRHTRLSSGSGSAHSAGHAAGMSADTGSAGRVGQRRELSR